MEPVLLPLPNTPAASDAVEHHVNPADPPPPSKSAVVPPQVKPPFQAKPSSVPQPPAGPTVVLPPNRLTLGAPPLTNEAPPLTKPAIALSNSAEGKADGNQEDADADADADGDYELDPDYRDMTVSFKGLENGGNDEDDLDDFNGDAFWANLDTNIPNSANGGKKAADKMAECVTLLLSSFPI
ncbi:hypothetical protein NMY22_g20189 [Coprinellus aureogranulatus]|nr:hypothetical protein NMY22_g20189 [Coprinellus aureogranulatus]